MTQISRRSVFRLALAALGLAALLLSFSGKAVPASPRLPYSAEEVQLSYAPLVKKVAPAVVNIYAQKLVQSSGLPLFADPFFGRFFGDDFGGLRRERVQNSLGSGVIVGAEGLVVTNHHVIAGADEITVVLNDRREFKADIVISDQRTDLTVLRLRDQPADLPFLAFGDSDALEVGDLVLAIGNPFGVGQTVTSGIVSAVARTAMGISDYRFFIQTDAAINPGNSGGALVNLAGELVGINTAIYSRSGGSQGIGFAIPVAMVRAVYQGVARGGKVVRPWLGASGQPVTADVAASLGLDRPAGVLINRVREDSPAAKAGLKVGDIITGLGTFDITGTEELRFRLATLPVGENVTLLIIRDQKPLTLTVALLPPPEIPPRDETVLEGNHPLAGARVANLSPAVVEELGMESDAAGVVILDLASNSAAARLGFRPGDVIVSINGVAVPSVTALKERLTQQGRRWEVVVDRGGRQLVLRFGI